MSHKQTLVGTSRIAGTVAVVVLSSCAYRPGSFNARKGPFPGKRIITGCLDVAIAPAAEASTVGGEVIELNFGNRCDQRVRVDIGAIRVRATLADGLTAPLVPVDPKAEIRPLELDMLATGREVIEYRIANAPVAASVTVTNACFDVTDLTDTHSGNAVVCLEATQ